MDAGQHADVEVDDVVKGSDWESVPCLDRSDDVQKDTPLAEGLQIQEQDSHRNEPIRQDTKGDMEEARREDAALSKDTSKKKRSSKTAKLKQSKLDIRREQFLAQVAGKAVKTTGTLEGGKEKGTPGATASTQGSNSSSCDSSECTNGAQSSTTGSCGSSVCTNGTPEDDVEDQLQNLEAAFSDTVTIKEDAAPELSSHLCQAEAEGGAVEVLGCAIVSAETVLEATGEGGPLPGETNGGKGSSTRGTRKRQNGRKGANGEHSHKGKVAAGGSSGSPLVRPDAIAGHQSPKNGAAVNQLEDDDWEVAAEEFSKQVMKAIKPGQAEVSEGISPLKKAPASTLPALKNTLQGKPTAAGAEYNLRPNQQEAVPARLDAPYGQRLCGPNGLRPAYACSGSSFSRSGAGPRHTIRSAVHHEDESLFGRPRSSSDRAWRPDDISRPPTLPPAMVHQGTASRRLLGEGDLLVHQMDGREMGLGAAWTVNDMSGNNMSLRDLPHSQWPVPSSAAAAAAGVVNQPQCCPICAEELDVTDSSFDPCTCGFRLCLFCHHRIAADDGRCPGCRRAYIADATVRQPKQTHMWLKL